jgi:hypothetical protein
MNRNAARAVADTVLYEGYLLYPYRASAQKNRSRWQFGVLMPEDYVAVDPSESASLRAECVMEYGSGTSVEVLVRFLQVQCREGAAGPWQEAVEREHLVTATVGELLGAGRQVPLHVPGGEDVDGNTLRRRHPLDAVISVRGTRLDGPWQAMRLRVDVTNHTRLDPVPADRPDALPTAMVAVHLIVGASSGAFVSMVDPPEWAGPGVASCANLGCWPVLAGPPGSRDTVLAAPIILYDYPQVAPESPGDLFDATEIDEILSLRTLALTDAEKREARATDARAAAVIDRVEAMDGLAMERLHGAIRFLRPAGDAPADAPWWDPAADASVSPETDTVAVGGVRLGRGSTVRLRPGARRADAQDMFLVGRLAVVEAVLLDVDDRPYLAVTLADDPDADLRRAHGRYLYFTPDEVALP